MISLTNLLKHQEGIKLQAYKDSLGNWTIGIGTLITDPVTIKELDKGRKIKISKVAAEFLLQKGIDEAVGIVSRFLGPKFKLSGYRLMALQSMAYCMGNRLLQFENLYEALFNGQYKQAGKEVLNSKWAKKQAKNRAMATAYMVEYNKLPKEYRFLEKK